MQCTHKNNKKTAFSLAEIAIVIVIMSIIASFAIPRFRTTLEISRTGEAIRVVKSLYDRQILRKFETGSYTNLITDLSIEVPPLKYFEAPVVRDGLWPSNPHLVYLERTGSSLGPPLNYRFAMKEDGTLICEAWCCPSLCDYGKLENMDFFVQSAYACSQEWAENEGICKRFHLN